MALTQAQRALVRTAIQADGAANALYTSGQTGALMDWCNAKQTPTVKAWRTAYSGDELYVAHKPVEYIARSAGERQAFDLMVNRRIDPTKVAIRKGIEDIFSGASNSTSRAAILNDMQEKATRAEVAIGGPTATTAVDAISGLNRNFVGSITIDDVRAIVSGA